MRILIVTDAWRPQVNGVVRTLTETIRELQGFGHTVEMITPQSFTTLPCPTYPDIRLSLFPYRKVARMIAAFNPDAIHIATEGPLGLAARRFCRRHDKAFTTAYHTRFPEYIQARTRLPLAISYAWMRRFHNAGSAVMAPTQSIVDDLRARGFRNVVLWSRGVDTGLFTPGPRERLDESQPPRFVYIGRVAVEKNIEAFLRLDLPGSKWVVGDGPLLAKLKKQYPEVHFAGIFPQPELVRFYRAADVFVFPSLTDTFGLVLLEAMACGTPVAAYPVAGPLDVVGDSGAGVLGTDLRQACLQALALDREHVRAVAEGFSWQAAARQFEQHLHPNAHQAELAAAHPDAVQNSR
ncbi:MAG: glycosyltransferase family 1 protein [Paludibacterium sp.]|uniref:glycosyltransferase family 4 protein n=1 Tax=Paludibacterium sp. TaxID=1917523 RepID=UPI0025DAB220|nr:glycosyltransferase family 1 protein [Paludibacterium sp.]MBV8046075.1 glycosyltransferase family 1 protein [Paludibacterium sp.]MBV8646164.1 glycosyltransferase family 1 protein [Paludibacterium sp.]